MSSNHRLDKTKSETVTDGRLEEDRAELGGRAYGLC